jgi:hypothetical protein
MTLTALTVSTGLLVASCSVYDQRLVMFEGPGPSALPLPRAGAPAVIESAQEAAPDEAPIETVSPPIAASMRVLSCLTDSAGDYCTSLPRLPGEPAIDGTLECGLTLADIGPLGWNGSAPPPERHVRYAAAWCDQGLYIYVEVHGAAPVRPHPAGSPLYCGDAIELYADSDAVNDALGSYDSAGTMQFVVAAPSDSEAAIEAGRFIQGNPSGPWISRALHTQPLPDGYALEALITGDDLGLWSWTPAERLGFSLVVDVASPDDTAATRCGLQLGQYFLHLSTASSTCPGEPWCDARAFCAPALAP